VRCANRDKANEGLNSNWSVVAVACRALRLGLLSGVSGSAVTGESALVTGAVVRAGPCDDVGRRLCNRPLSVDDDVLTSLVTSMGMQHTPTCNSQGSISYPAPRPSPYATECRGTRRLPAAAAPVRAPARRPPGLPAAQGSEARRRGFGRSTVARPRTAPAGQPRLACAHVP
jgi:hypothetical protein